MDLSLSPEPCEISPGIWVCDLCGSRNRVADEDPEELVYLESRSSQKVGIWNRFRRRIELIELMGRNHFGADFDGEIEDAKGAIAKKDATALWCVIERVLEDEDVCMLWRDRLRVCQRDARKLQSQRI